MLRRWTRRVLFAVGLLLFAAIAVLLVAPRTAVVRELLRARTVAALAALTDADVRIGSVGGSLLHTLVVDDVRLAVAGRTVVRVTRVEIAFALFPLLRGTLQIGRASCRERV